MTLVARLKGAHAGESASRAELEGFGVVPADRRAMWRETVEQVANIRVS